MSYWIFKANPEKYDIDGRLLDPDPDIIWAVTRYHDRIRKGDTVFIWRTGTPRGICAVMEIEINPYEPEYQEIYDGFVVPSDNTAATNSALWAKCRITQRFPIIEANVIKKIPGLELFSFFSAFQQATNFSITRPEGTILLEFIEKYQTEEHENVLKPAVKSKKPVPARAASAKKNKPAALVSVKTTTPLLKCKACSRYVVSTDTDRHVREAHAGQPVEWVKVK